MENFSSSVISLLAVIITFLKNINLKRPVMAAQTIIFNETYIYVIGLLWAW